MTDKTVSPLPDHECKYCKTVHVGCCSKACVLKKNPNYPLPSVPTESRPKWKREQEIADKFRPAVAEIFRLESDLPVNDPLRHRLYLVRCELGRIDYDARSKA